MCISDKFYNRTSNLNEVTVVLIVGKLPLFMIFLGMTNNFDNYKL